MKLLATTLGLAAAAGNLTQCNLDGGKVFNVTCGADLVIKLDITSSCLGYYYPGVEVTELQLLPTNSLATAPSDQCTACTATNTTTCSSSANFYSNNDLNGTVTDSSSAIYYQANSCGLAMNTSSNTTAVFATSIGNHFNITSGLNIIAEATMPAITFNCTYDNDIDGKPITIGTPDMNFLNSADVFEEQNGTQTISNSAITLSFPTETKVGGKYVLGSTLAVQADDIAGVLTDNFYFDQCTATNAAGNKSFSFFNFTNADCFQDSAVASLIGLNYAPGRNFNFSVFGFFNEGADNTTTSDDSISVKITCDVIISNNLPTCGVSGRRRRDAHSEDAEYQTVEWDMDIADYDGDYADEYDGMVYYSEYYSDSGTSALCASLFALSAAFFMN